jgi:cobalt-zinc-cadmium resistance protein CzcA
LRESRPRQDDSGPAGYLISWSLANRPLVLFLAAVWLAIGLSSLADLPIDAVPDVTNVQVTVNTEAIGLPPPEVESLITIPVETALLGLPHVEEVRSLSKYGLSQVTVVFDEGTDLYFARQLVGERLSGAGEDFPPGVGQPAMGPIATGLSEIYQYELVGDERWNSTELRTLHDWFVKRQLLSVEGVTEVNSFGGWEKQYEVVLDPVRLQAYGLDYHQVFEVLESDNRNVGGGFLESRGDQLLVRGLSLAQSMEDLGALVVHSRDGRAIRLADVADLKVGGALRQGAVSRDGRGEAVIGIVMMLAGENSRTVAHRVDQRIAELREELPEGVQLDTFYNRTELVDRTLRTVSKNLIEGALLVVLVLFVFLGDIRAALVVSSVIPFSFLFAASLMLRTGVSGNLMSLGALDFGLIVDGAVVMTEHTVAALVLLSGTGSMVERVEHACRQMARPMLFGLGIIIAVYLPLLALTGLEGKMFRPMALTVVYALLGSMILSFTLVPVLLSLVLKPQGGGQTPPLVVRLLTPVYQRLLEWVLAFPRLTALVAAIPLVISLFWASRLGAVFLPELDEGSLALQAIRIPSVSLTNSLTSAQRVEKALKEFPEVFSVISKTGRPDLATDPMGVEISDVIVTLKPPAQWTVSSKDELVEKMRKRLELLPGINFSFSQPIELRVEELISGSRSDVALQIYGEDLEELARLGGQLVSRLQKLEGARDVSLEAIGGVPYLQLEVDRQAASRYGIPPGEILDLIAILFGQQPLSIVLEGERRFPVVATVPATYRATPEGLSSLKIRTPDGAYVPLSSVVRVIPTTGTAQVNRVNGQRRAVISMNYSGSDLVGFVGRAQEAVSEVLPAGVVTGWGGEFQNYQRARARLIVLVPLVMAGILCLLWMSLGRMSWALVIFLNVPFAAVGGVMALGLRGMPFSISAGVGFLTLFGVAVLNGLVLMAAVSEQIRVQGLEQDDRTAESTATSDPSWLDVVRHASESRLRPVLMTALVASLGFLPMALASGAGAEVQKPLATVVIGGLLSSTLLTLGLLPGLLSLLPPSEKG